MRVERIARCSLGEFYERYLSKRKPVIFTGLSDDWPARRKWTWRSLAKKYGTTKVRVRIDAGRIATIPLSRYVDYVQSPSDYDAKGTPYLRDWTFLADHPEMAADFTEPFFANDWLKLVSARVRPDFRWLYVGPKASKSSLHIDTSGTHAWLCQLIGSKRWKLYAPTDVPKSYLGRADVFRLDRERFPKLATATCWEATLEAGEVIFVPYGWRHQVQNLAPSLALTGNYVDASNYVDCAKQLTDGRSALRVALDDVLFDKSQTLLSRLTDARELEWEQRWLKAGMRFARRTK